MGTLALSVAGPRAPAHPLWQEGVFLSPQRLCVCFLNTTIILRLSFSNQPQAWNGGRSSHPRSLRSVLQTRK